jgi:hypothetical protein
LISILAEVAAETLLEKRFVANKLGQQPTDDAAFTVGQVVEDVL